PLPWARRFRDLLQAAPGVPPGPLRDHEVHGAAVPTLRRPRPRVPVEVKPPRHGAAPASGRPYFVATTLGTSTGLTLYSPGYSRFRSAIFGWSVITMYG